MTSLLRKINRMDEFEIDEVSHCDKPAQTPALALIMKAAGDPELRKRVRLTSVEDGHQHLVDMNGAQAGHTSHDPAAGAEFGHSHPVVQNDDGSISIGMADGHTHTVIMKMATDEDLAALSGNPLEPAVSGGGPNGETPMTKTAEEIAAEEAQAVQKRVEKAEARAERAEQLASLTDVQKAHNATLSPEAQAEYLSASPDQRQAAVEKAAGDDPVVYTTLAGEEIRKSAGSLLLDLAKRADQSEQDLAVEKAAREHETFAKRAKDELSNLPGKESSQVALLKAVDGIPNKEDQAGALEIIKAANEGVSKAFDTAGTVDGGGGDAAGAEAKLEKMAQDHFKADSGGSFGKSYKAVLETPEGRELYKQTRS